MWAFFASKLHHSAVIRCLEVMGEAAGLVSTAFRAGHAAFPWWLMADMRNRLIHGYAVVDLDLIWDTVQSELPPLVATLRVIVPPEVPTDLSPEPRFPARSGWGGHVKHIVAGGSESENVDACWRVRADAVIGSGAIEEGFMASITVRNLDDDLKRRLRIRAAEHGRRCRRRCGKSCAMPSENRRRPRTSAKLSVAGSRPWAGSNSTCRCANRCGSHRASIDVGAGVIVVDSNVAQELALRIQALCDSVRA